MYNRVLKPFLFLLDPEKAHHLTFALLRHFSWLTRWLLPTPIADKRLERTVFGITFKNPVGLAAGMDKDATAYKEMNALGFGFVEIGTLTPRPQPGNPPKRLFRLVEDEAVINRMGFNNQGVDQAVRRLRLNTDVVIGGNIGKNKDTPNEKATEDYLYCYNKLYPVVDYFVVNVSSPNTPNLRELQEKEPLLELLSTLQAHNSKQSKPKPILLKIAPDLTDGQLLDIIGIVEQTQIAGVIATNTTITRTGVKSPLKEEAGGLSGSPLRKRSTEVIRFLHEKSNGAFPIIGVGGILSAQDALEKIEAGASLVQIYTGFIYRGPELIREINQALLTR